MDKIILGGIIGFFAATGQYFITNYFQNKKEKKKFYREKLEEIFILTDKTQHKILTTQTSILNDNIKPTGEFDNSSSKLSMLIQYYAPDIEKEYQEYLKVWANVGQYLISDVFKKEKNQEEYVAKMQTYNQAYLNFKKIIRNEANKYI